MPAVTVRDLPSPNFGPRRTAVRYLVVHYTGMVSAAAALGRLCDAAAEVSTHYLIDEDGAVTRLVAEGMRAWHAGTSYWRGERDLNSASVGIELVNPGHAFGYRPFPAVQIAALTELSQNIMERHGIPAGGVLGHSDVAPGRKIDPGELFPWKDLSRLGIGLWPSSIARNTTDASPAAVLRWLNGIGYATPLSPEVGGDILDPVTGTADVIAAFQRRYRQTRVDGMLDLETAGLIAAVSGLHDSTTSAV